MHKYLEARQPHQPSLIGNSAARASARTVTDGVDIGKTSRKGKAIRRLY
jgi:hypothetical protein